MLTRLVDIFVELLARRIEAKLDRLEKLIRVAAPHPLGEPK